MNDSSFVRSARFDKGVLIVAVVLGLLSGVVEGLGHMIFVKLDLLGNAWYPIIWITPFFNGLVVGSMGLALTLGLSLVGNHRRVRTFVVFMLMFASFLPPLALMLYER